MRSIRLDTAMEVLSRNSSLLMHRQLLPRIVLLSLLFSFAPSTAHGSDLLLVSSEESYSLGETFTATITVNPEGTPINAANALLRFDPSALQVLSLSKESSAFSVWSAQPVFSNEAGTITFAGGTPESIAYEAPIITVTFRVLQEKDGVLTFEQAAIFAADGSGNNVIEDAHGLHYSATAVPNDAPVSDDEEQQPMGALVPSITSVDFSDQEKWYNRTDGTFAWNLPAAVTAVAVEVSTSSVHEPMDVLRPPEASYALEDGALEEGIQYLHVQFKDETLWGAVATHKLKIDNTAPEAFTLALVQNDSEPLPQLSFSTTDELSGIDHYEVTFSNSMPIVVFPEQAGEGFVMPNLQPGAYKVVATAVDKAGNRGTSTPLMLLHTDPSGQKATPAVAASDVLAALLALAMLCLLWLMLLMRSRFNQKETRLRKETKDLQNQMGKIFSALRDEIYDQVNTISQKKRMTAKEKDVVASLNQAITVSETLIAKELTDVKKVLRKK